MISIKKRGNLLQENVDALVNTVNCVGVMGKGIALQFKMMFPQNFNEYKRACERNEVKPCKMFIFDRGRLFGPRFIINFPTKVHWKDKSKIEYIKCGLADLIYNIQKLEIKSIAIPPLGSGSGGLEWSEVKPLIIEKMELLRDIKVIVYEPSRSPKPEEIKVSTKKPKMTFGRAALILLLQSYREIGYGLTQLEIQKLMYFLQEAGEPLQLKFEKAKYGPYANNLHHVLQAIENHYIKGYGDRTYESQIHFLPEGIEKADLYWKENPHKLSNFIKVKQLIEGFETPYGLELLATVHWIIKSEGIKNTNEIYEFIQNWTPRKKQLFSIDHIKLAIKRLETTGFF